LARRADNRLASFYALQGLDIRARQIDNGRYDTIEEELHSGKPPKLGRPAKDMLNPKSLET
jgi:hypothetical protein